VTFTDDCSKLLKYEIQWNGSAIRRRYSIASIVFRCQCPDSTGPARQYSRAFSG